MSPLRLHGYAVSNYVNIVRAALIEKRLDFDFVDTRASQDAGFLAISPMGKIPVLETPHGWLAETVAILEYLDDAYPDAALRPADVADRARSRQIVNIIQMYVEAPARSLFPGVFADGVNPPATVAAVRATLDRATAALARLMQPSPFLFGAAPGTADLFAFYNFDVCDRVTRIVYGRSIVEEIGTLGDWWPLMRDRASSRIVLADFATCFAAYLVDHNAAYHGDDAPISGQFADA